MKQEATFFYADHKIIDAAGNAVTFKSFFVDPTMVRTLCKNNNRQSYFVELQSKGFSVLRIGICWDFVEHEGPDLYDEAFLADLRDLVKDMEAYHFAIVIVPCAKSWSMHCGGYGAPDWTVDLVATALSKEKSEINSAVMNGLFYDGNTLSVGKTIEGCLVQDFLQNHFIAAMLHTARRLKDVTSIIGFEVLDVIDMGIATGSAMILAEHLARFVYCFTTAYVKKHPHYIMFAPEVSGIEYISAVTALQPGLSVCSSVLLG